MNLRGTTANSQRLEFASRLLLVTMGTDQQIVNLTSGKGRILLEPIANTGFENVDTYTGSTDMRGSL